MTERARIRDEGNRKRSEAAKGNTNAAKDRENSTCTQSTRTVSKTPERKAKAKHFGVNVGAVAGTPIRGSKVGRCDATARCPERANRRGKFGTSGKEL